LSLTLLAIVVEVIPEPKCYASLAITKDKAVVTSHFESRARGVLGLKGEEL